MKKRLEKGILNEVVKRGEKKSTKEL